MAIEKSMPGQKGVNWSNIAVGQYTRLWLSFACNSYTLMSRCNHEHGKASLPLSANSYITDPGVVLVSIVCE